ncbi:helix-turn-helix transcriptional regulator [Alteromonas sp. CI.11.F.A3]|uniref:AraC family transcriptional regulator n=1 Tax=Alteromonas sp. CI.11.F.A3 TaxID=3079555 RepID=UPI0029428461|nr:helix-turn-helix transcriptional regulator [Alteromonas sp. CI.11.F.A3]WOI38994.1 helix-turn-helix transcriptional regulator [Alteromonas sp. CI.11.F.A3]
MTKNILLPPSEASQEPLNVPVKVVQRDIPKQFEIEMHSHEWGQFVYASKGVMLVETPEHCYIVPPEQGVWLLPHVNHKVRALTHVFLTSFYIATEMLIHMPQESGVLEVSPFLQVLIDEAKYFSGDYTWEDTQGLHLRLILHTINKAPSAIFQLPFPSDKRLVAILYAIRETPSNNYSLEQWGNTVGASSRTLSRLFKKETGLHYSEWRQRLIIQIAIGKLNEGGIIANVAHDLGYESPSAFTYMFREKTGMTPSAFKRSTFG